MNIFYKEIRANVKSLVFWCFVMIFLLAGAMSKYSAGAAAGLESFSSLLESMPKTLLTIFGISSFDITKISGFYGITFLYIVITAAIHAVVLGADTISKEERDKTSEFLYVKPVSREAILFQKLLAACIQIVILNFVTGISSVYIINIFAPTENITHEIMVLMVALFFIQMIYLTIGAGTAAVLKKSKRAVVASTLILLATYFLSLFVELIPHIQFLKYLTPFKYFEAQNLMYGGNFDVISLVLTGVIVIGGLSIAFIFFRKRDIAI